MLSQEAIEIALAVRDAKDKGFRNLIAVARLDPARDLIGADLQRVDFGDADYFGCDFARCDLSGANLSRARGLRREMFVGVEYDGATLWPPGFTPPGARDPFVGWGAAKPSWADAWGRDEFGPWVTFSVPAQDGARVVQRMRWCPPGRFLMGSPEDEIGRYRDEGPRHEVTIADGFWLMDTPCTQALWRAVMGGNPSRFKSPARPVERVSFKKVDQFIRALNRLRPGLDVSLPSEALWEYACRAGTATATYAGDLAAGDAASVALLDPIAWYALNTGVGTQPVAGKRPNAWGLHDMLGNVLEWCPDSWHDSYAGAPNDGSAWLGEHPAADRVLRGGSWCGEARDVRSACRYRNVPDGRGGDIGFRCARVQVSDTRSGAARAGQGGAGGGSGATRARRPARPAPRGGEEPP